MRIAMFYQSLISDWNHGNAHFLRGIVTEFQRRGHHVAVFEPKNGWSLQNLVAERGKQPIDDFHQAYPSLRSSFYDPHAPELEKHLEDADLVIVHESNEPALVKAIGNHRKHHDGYTLLFHDTNHRSVTAPESMREYDLSEYDGVLAYGEVIRRVYLRESWAKQAWTWHEAADVQHFNPVSASETAKHDLVWIGNWGDGERTYELQHYLIEPVVELGLSAAAYGVRYPESDLEAMRNAGITFSGWCPNYRVPQIFSQYRCTIHLPRRPYREQLPGIPSIRVFEALACGIPLVCLKWPDTERLFRYGDDYLAATSPAEMKQHIRAILNDQQLANRLISKGRQAIFSRHTCRHRVDQLFQIVESLRPTLPAVPAVVAAPTGAVNEWPQH